MAIESDTTNSSISKPAIYAALGLPELWRYRKRQVEIGVAESRYEYAP